MKRKYKSNAIWEVSVEKEIGDEIEYLEKSFKTKRQALNFYNNSKLSEEHESRVSLARYTLKRRLPTNWKIVKGKWSKNFGLPFNEDAYIKNLSLN